MLVHIFRLQYAIHFAIQTTVKKDAQSGPEWAKIKTDKIDAVTLAKLHASGFLPEVWHPDEETAGLRRLVAERSQLVSQRTRLKNRVQSILHAIKQRVQRLLHRTEDHPV
jgi:transposase